MYLSPICYQLLHHEMTQKWHAVPSPPLMTFAVHIKVMKNEVESWGLKDILLYQTLNGDMSSSSNLMEKPGFIKFLMD